MADNVISELAQAMAEHITSEVLGDPPSKWRAAYAELSNTDKVAVARMLAQRGLLNVVDARKKHSMSAFALYDSALGAYRLAKESHESVAANRHEPWQDSATFKKMATGA